MAQWEKVLATKPDYLSPIPGIHTVEGENGLLQVILRPSHEHSDKLTSSNKLIMKQCLQILETVFSGAN